MTSQPMATSEKEALRRLMIAEGEASPGSEDAMQRQWEETGAPAFETMLPAVPAATTEMLRQLPEGQRSLASTLTLTTSLEPMLSPTTLVQALRAAELVAPAMQGKFLKTGLGTKMGMTVTAVDGFLTAAQGQTMEEK